MTQHPQQQHITVKQYDLHKERTDINLSIDGRTLQTHE